jgi:hypothetical protein
VAAAIVAFLSLPNATTWAQNLFVGPGSTPDGDYLRGVGVAAVGMGIYNYDTALANRINTETYVFWNEYLYNVAKNENREAMEHRAAIREEHKKNRAEIEKRIRENPNTLDVIKGDALNYMMEELIGPKSRVQLSTLRLSSVPLSVDTIRRIPLIHATDNVRFSMQRLAIKGEKNWPVGLRGETIQNERHAYEQAMDAVLDQQLDRKLQRETIQKLETAIKNLRVRLDQVVVPDRETVYMEAKKFLDQLEQTKEMIKHFSVEKIIAEIDNYSGTTVYDLLVFMNTWNLRFGVSDIGDERKQLNDLYVAMCQQRDRVSDPGSREQN